MADLGNDWLHINKSVLIEGGRNPRARVMNQHVIDQYLMHGLLTLEQHRAGEYLLGQAVSAGLFATTINLSVDTIRGKKRDTEPRATFGFTRTVSGLARRYGWFHAWLVVEVVIRDRDVRKSSLRMGCLREALDWICNFRMGGVPNPMRRLQVAANLEL